MAVLLLLAGSATAWGASANIAAVDGLGDDGTAYVQSPNMGAVLFSDYPGVSMTAVRFADVNAATLANYDTLFLFACNPDVFSDSQKDDIVAFVNNGGKLVIWDAEDPGAGNSWDYSWLPTQFATNCPGATGDTGYPITIVEENQLSKSNPLDSLYIDVGTLGSQSDAVADSNIFTSYVPDEWCVDMTATNFNDVTGPVHVYTKSFGQGILIYSGLDWDYASQLYSPVTGPILQKILLQEFTAASLPCSVPITPTLDVIKVADKTVYNVDDTVTFTVTVTNPGTVPAEDVTLTDSPPPEVSLSQTVYPLGDIAPGNSASVDIIGKAVKEGCNLENEVVATGLLDGDPFFNGGATATFSIGTACGPVSTPEFPTLALPVGMLLGLVFVVYSIKKIK